MKIEFPSSIYEPLFFFKWFYRREILEKYKDWFYDDKDYENEFYEPRINPSQVANREEGFIKFLDSNNDFEERTLTIADSLLKFISVQANRAIFFINQNVTANIDKREPLLRFYLSELKEIEENANPILEETPELLFSVINIQNYLNKRYLKGQLRKQPTLFKDSNDRIVFELLSYLSGFNDKQEKILTDSDYERLMLWIGEYLRNDIIPNDILKIPKLKGIDNQLLMKSFHVLWKQTKNTKNTRMRMAHFLHSVFDQLKNYEVSVVNSKMSYPISHNRPFLPLELMK